MNLKLPRVEGRGKKRKYFTLLMIPNNENSMRKWRIPGFLVPVMVVLSIIGLSSIGFFAYGYFTFQGEVESLRFLRGVNAAQAKQINHLEEQAKDLANKLEIVDEFDQKIRSMVGLEGEDNPDEKQELKGEGGGLEPLSWEPEANAERVLSEERQRDYEQHKNMDLASRSIDHNPQETYHIKQIAADFEELQEKAEKKTMQLELLMAEVEERLDYLATVPDHWPLKGRITSTFGWRVNPVTKRAKEFHGGIDIAARAGTPIKAAARGKVVFAGYRSGWGRVLVIDHGNGYQTQYSHNSSLLAKVGEQVEKGQIIARVGNTGRSTGPHLDFRVEKDGELIDPMDLLKD